VGVYWLSSDVLGAQSQKPEPNLAVGKAAYEQQCARCHGVSGQGDGRDAKRFYPRPRNFVEGVYKFRSTESGTPPTEPDLFDTLTRGLPGSGMPDWRHLDESLRWQLVYYIQNLSSSRGTAPAPISFGHDPGAKGADLAKGKQIYEKLGCAACHGPQGRANGPSATTLVDNAGLPIRPANLTQGWNYRGGSDPRAIVQRLMTGLDGTPMPSYAEAVSPEDAWQLAYYVRSLQRQPHWTMLVKAAHVDAAASWSLDDPRWASVEAADVRLRNAVTASGEITGPLSVSTLTLQAVADAQALTLRVSWPDPLENREAPVDALALAFHSRAVAGDVITLQAWPLKDSPALDLLVWSADWPHAQEAVVRDYEAIRAPTSHAASRVSSAAYRDGLWTVVLTRPFSAEDPDAAQLAPGDFVPLAVAVWEGSNPTQRAVSGWIDVILQAPRSASQPELDRSIYVVWVASAIALMAGGLLALTRPTTRRRSG